METIKKHKLILVFIAGIFSAVILNDLLNIAFSSKEIIRKDCNKEKSHCFYAIRYKRLSSSEITFNVARYVKDGYPDYGHYMEYPFPYATSASEENNEIKKASIEFTEDGMTYTHPTNHVIFVPRKAYIVGR